MTKDYPDVGVQALTGYSTCKFEDINTSTLSSGEWSILVEFKNSSAQGSAKTVQDIE
jgi:hypothetical protein